MITMLTLLDDNAMMGMASSSGAGKSGSSGSLASKDPKPPADNVERRANALAALKLICESPVFLPHLEALLAMQDAQVRSDSYTDTYLCKVLV